MTTSRRMVALFHMVNSKGHPFQWLEVGVRVNHIIQSVSCIFICQSDVTTFSQFFGDNSSKMIQITFGRSSQNTIISLSQPEKLPSWAMSGTIHVNGSHECLITSIAARVQARFHPVSARHPCTRSQYNQMPNKAHVNHTHNFVWISRMNNSDNETYCRRTTNKQANKQMNRKTLYGGYTAQRRKWNKNKNLKSGRNGCESM